MRFPDKLDVLAVHARLIAETGGSAGIRDEGLLEPLLVPSKIGSTMRTLTLSNVLPRMLITSHKRMLLLMGTNVLPRQLQRRSSRLMGVS